MMEQLQDVIFDQDSIREFREWTLQARRFVITAHTQPDGDALGASLAMYAFLRQMGKEPAVILPNQFPDFLRWLPGASEVMFYRGVRDKANALIAAADVIVMLDFNVLSRTDQMEEPIKTSGARKVLIDHHLDPGRIAGMTFSYPLQSSTCELLYRLLVASGFQDQVTRVMAACLYTGMMTDTGGFTYNSSRPEVFTILSQLLRKGIDKDLIYRKVNLNYSSSRLFLQGQVLSSMQVLAPFHTAILMLSRSQQRRFNLLRGDSEGFVNLPLQIGEVILSCFLREDTDKDQVKLSFRSVGDFSCNDLARHFGGGGHLNAAGAEMPQVTVEEASIRLKAVLMGYAVRLEECFRKGPK